VTTQGAVSAWTWPPRRRADIHARPPTAPG
jgi:hypothetical protein